VGLHDSFEVLWHAGEPLVLPSSWYRAAHDGLSEVLGADRVRFNFQTNGTSITPEWVRFFAELKPRTLGLSPEEQEGANARNAWGGMEGEKRYRRFLQLFIERWLDGGRPFQVREFRRAQALMDLRGMGGSGLELESQQCQPGEILTVGWNGDVYTYSPELLGIDLPGWETKLGNVHRDSWNNVTQTVSFQELKRAIDEGVSQCRRSCDYFAYCGGGTPGNKWFEHGSFAATETRYCRLGIQAPLDLYLEAVGCRGRESTLLTGFPTSTEPSPGDPGKVRQQK
jgi:uncharacterized protein